MSGMRWEDEWMDIIGLHQVEKCQVVNMAAVAI